MKTSPRLYPTSRLLGVIAALGLGLTACATAQEAEPAPAPAQEQVPSAESTPAPAQTTDPAVVELLQEIEAAAAELKTLRGRVRYTVQQGLLGDQQRRFGDFYYAVADGELPTRLAIHFDRLVVDDRVRQIDRRYIFDGYWLLEENHDDKNATRRELVPLGQAQDDVLQVGGNEVRFPIRLKADAILAEFDVTRLPDTELGEQTLLHLRLVPRRTDNQNNQRVEEPMEVWFEQQTKLLTKVVYIDTQGDTDDANDDTIELLLSLVRPNFEIEPDIFDTALPPASENWQVQEVPLE